MVLILFIYQNDETIQDIYINIIEYIYTHSAIIYGYPRTRWSTNYKDIYQIVHHFQPIA